MILIKILSYSLLFLHCCSLLSARTFTNREGVSIEADIVSVLGDTVKIRKDGRVITARISSFSEEDQQYIINHSSVKPERDSAQRVINGASAEKINRVLGVELFSDANLWDDAIGELSKRNGWPIESKTKNQSSYRLYPKPDYSLLGARPHSVALYGHDGKPTRLSIVFANKGDIEVGSTHGDVVAAIERDADVIGKKLKSLFGSGRHTSFGKEELAERVRRWNWGEHAFLLSEQEGEYLCLRIMPLALADTKGMGRRVTDNQIRTKMESSIVRRDNGDVVIGNIPMVHQGPKGYCVPATYERYLRYMGIPADMYILAMAGNTSIGGGTSMGAIYRNVEAYVNYRGRNLKNIKSSISLTNLKPYLNKGIPIICTLFSSESYNHVANVRTQERREVEDISVWKRRCNRDNAAAETQIVRDMQTAHVCLIIGYNAMTGEIAVSDSWGIEYEERWVTVEQLSRVTMGGLTIIKR